ncbi:hypothetical protein HELRODRAFT_167128 [Helobdella robusta]|uniref:Uncharacterized protein n=1 Tax=Helobdella robusta TaxID=6412 RepID=T1EZ21_HELRO|nr:hypothetical protein HELRODRAFT_167128 [Helobdella robusta]ESO10621.1 hypothetical protein HELRODRAFT_167128 [Helobdella robusta]
MLTFRSLVQKHRYHHQPNSENESGDSGNPTSFKNRHHTEDDHYGVMKLFEDDELDQSAAAAKKTAAEKTRLLNAKRKFRGFVLKELTIDRFEVCGVVDECMNE